MTTLSAKPSHVNPAADDSLSAQARSISQERGGIAGSVQSVSLSHTPGPWRVEYGRSGYPRGIYADGDAGKPGAVGCVVRYNGIGLPSSPMGHANAHLIAAAPDLLAELRHLAALPDTASPEYVRNRARAAIERATK